ncbi:MAG: ATP-binding cassette domain-containing protein [Deltaproteobacteria bacterium]|nr:ATP-binding cassette domain-containing protein [Deltaproteobacteria bacterium]MBW2322207.1 ATP-binding cassette domain-containing protein [Deltaproteobacteria bacterium]
MSELIYELSKLVHRYGEHVVLEIEQLSIRKGRIIGVAGPNGSGKSTLLKILAFLQAPSEGMVYFEGQRVTFSDPPPRREATLLLQDPYLLKRSVFENVAYGLKLRRDKNDLTRRVGQALTWVGLDPKSFTHRSWNELSGGEAQRVALASRLILKPKVLLLDEPLASVDAASAELIMQASFRARRDWGATLVIVSHDLIWMHEVADEVLSLFNGSLAGTGARNLIMGPWQISESGLWRKELEDGQQIIAQSPSGDQSVAVLDPSDVSISPKSLEPASQRNAVKGAISQMIFEKNQGKVLVNVTADSISLYARMTEDAIKALSLHPGQTVWVSFDFDAFQWL